MAIGWLSFSAMAATLASLATPIASVLLNQPGLAGPLRLSSLYLVGAGINGLQLGILAGLEEFKAIARVNAIRAVVNLPLTVAAAFWLGLEGVVGTMVLMTVATGVLLRIEMRRATGTWNIRLRYAIDWSHARLFWRFSLPAFLAGNLVVPASWAVNAILVHQSNGYAEMGLLNAASQWRALAILIPAIGSSVTLPIHSNLYAEADRKRYHRTVLANLTIQSALSSVVVVTLVTVGPLVLGAYGPGFLAGRSAFFWLSLSWWFLAPNWILWGVTVSSSRVWTGLLFNLIGALTLLGLAWAWGNQGARGIAMAHFVAGAVQFVFQGGHFVVWRKTQLT